MLHSLKSWIHGGPPGADWRSITAWAKQRGLSMKRVRDGDGFAIDGTVEGVEWRLEWGPPQRTYVATRELRLRADMPLHSGLQMLLLSRPLMEKLEADTFELYTETLQTRIDSSTPEEMRWLAMFPKVDLSGVRTVRSHFGSVASVPSAALRWISGPLGVQLAQSRLSLLSESVPFVLMAQRNRVQLRVECEFPGAREVEQAVLLFETAVRQVQVLVDERFATDGGASTQAVDSGLDASSFPDRLADRSRNRGPGEE